MSNPEDKPTDQTAESYLETTTELLNSKKGDEGFDRLRRDVLGTKGEEFLAGKRIARRGLLSESDSTGETQKAASDRDQKPQDTSKGGTILNIADFVSKK